MWQWSFVISDYHVLGTTPNNQNNTDSSIEKETWFFIGKPFARSIDPMTAPFGPMNWEHWCIILNKLRKLILAMSPTSLRVILSVVEHNSSAFSNVFKLNSHSKTSLFSAGTWFDSIGSWSHHGKFPSHGVPSNLFETTAVWVTTNLQGVNSKQWPFLCTVNENIVAISWWCKGRVTGNPQCCEYSKDIKTVLILLGESLHSIFPMLEILTCHVGPLSWQLNFGGTTTCFSEWRWRRLCV